MAKLKMSAPWNVFYQEIKAMFEEDQSVRVVYDEDETYIKLLVDEPLKAAALEKLLPAERVFGNVTVKVSVIPANRVLRRNFNVANDNLTTTEAILRAALCRNPAFRFVNTFYGLYNNPIIYVVFANKVVQYFNDDLCDYYGQCSTLYQNLAADIFVELDGVHYCTDKPDSRQFRGRYQYDNDPFDEGI